MIKSYRVNDLPVYFIVKASSKYILKICNNTLTSIKYNAFMYITNSNTLKHSQKENLTKNLKTLTF